MYLIKNCLPFGDAAGAAGRAGGGGRPGDGEAGGGRGGGAARAPPLSSASLVRSRSSQKDDEVWMVTGVSMGTEAAAAGGASYPVVSHSRSSLEGA